MTVFTLILAEYLIHLRAHFKDFLSYINLNSLHPWLVQYSLLTSDQSELLRNVHIGENERIVNLLGFMEKKGARGYSLFLQAIREEKEHIGHDELHEILSSSHIQKFEIGIQSGNVVTLMCKEHEARITIILVCSTHCTWTWCVWSLKTSVHVYHNIL